MRRLKFLLWPIAIFALIRIVAYLIGRRLRKQYLSLEVDEDSLNAVGIMSGWQDRSTSQSFKGGYVRAVMGGVDLDLTDAVVENKPAVIETTIFFGGVAIKAPQDWKVEVDLSPTLGGVQNERRRDDLPEDTTPDLIIKGNVTLGGLAVL